MTRRIIIEKEEIKDLFICDDDSTRSNVNGDKKKHFDPTSFVERDSVVAVVAKFSSDWSGFSSATELEKEFERGGCSKKEWEEKRGGDSESKVYGWCARAEDYNSEGPIGDYLSKEGKLRTVSDISQETAQDRNVNETAMSLHRVLDQKKALDESYAEETKKMSQMSILNIQKILDDKEKLTNELEAKTLRLGIAN